MVRPPTAAPQWELSVRDAKFEGQRLQASGAHERSARLLSKAVLLSREKLVDMPRCAQGAPTIEPVKNRSVQGVESCGKIRA